MTEVGERLQRWQQVIAGLVEFHGSPRRTPPPLGNHSNPDDEAVYIQLTYMTKAQDAVEGAYGHLRELCPDGWHQLGSTPDDALESALRPLGLITRRVRNLRGLIAAIKERHDGSLETLRGLSDDDLLRALMDLPGLGPKGARCVAAYSFGRNLLAVDVHVLRLAKRLGFIERELSWSRATTVLEDQIRPDLRFDAHVLLVQHGRTICTNRAARCDSCVLADMCAEAFATSDRRADYVPELG